MRLKDKVAIITGGAEGLGKTYALAYAKEGAKLVIADINLPAANALAATLINQGTEALAMKTDVSVVPDVDEMAQKAADKFGKIDILVNNAAIYMRVKLSRVPLWQKNPDDWNRVIAVNLTGTFLCCRAVLPYMIKQKSGKIINVASSLAFAGMPGISDYVATKGGVVSLTRTLAREVGDYNINVNCIAPGSTLSEEPTEQAIEFRKKEIPLRALKRVEYPEDLVGIAIFLASAESDFMTGQTVVVDGGFVLH